MILPDRIRQHLENRFGPLYWNGGYWTGCCLGLPFRLLYMHGFYIVDVGDKARGHVHVYAVRRGNGDKLYRCSKLFALLSGPNLGNTGFYFDLQRDDWREDV